MAVKAKKTKNNIEGPYYVDDGCIGCGACIVEAPILFKMNETEGQAYVSKLPKTAEENKLMELAMAVCPVESIGDDG